MNKINQLFERKVEVPRIFLGKKQALETLINEEAILFAGYLRDEGKSWKPRIGMELKTPYTPESSNGRKKGGC